MGEASNAVGIAEVVSPPRATQQEDATGVHPDDIIDVATAREAFEQVSKC